VYRPSTADHDSSAVGAIVFSVYLLLIASFTIPAMVWGRRAYRQINDDLTAPLVSTRGRYLGSWAWRGLTGRLSSVTQQRRLNHFAGFPIAIEERPGEVTWFGAPVALLSEVRHFEQAIAAGTREVIVSYHPNTRAIARLEASDGSASVDLQRQIDELHPETGLQLKVSRRRRKAHLPDF
jgi:hypothetical protein